MGRERKGHPSWMDWTHVQKRREGSVICPKGVTGWQVGGSVRLSGAGAGERAVESGEAPALGPELSDPGTRSRGQCRAVRMGLCAPEHATHCAPYPQLCRVTLGRSCAHRASDFPVYRRHVPGPSELVFKPGGGRGNLSVGQASNFLGRILKNETERHRTENVRTHCTIRLSLTS